ncbi:SrfA family protein [Yersinia alsatica]|uniref:SrfA family protein n=1 Tax=Yersinia alsatica TaxID=2890317 RepID=UPI0016438A1F|nr:SrfA family protein [Yersinia alsatica]
MAKLFLRSGSLADILALGENGQPVYAAALQIREALRLKKQQHIADCLAIPQLNEQGDRIDWYSPIDGKVTSWIAASTTERKAAIKQLSACLASVNDLCQRAQQSDKAAQRLFGVLLAKAMQFPDQNHVYLVAGKPVLTFWGFVSQDKRTRTDPLDCLRETAENSEPTFSTLSATPPAPIPSVAPATVAAIELPPQADIAPEIPPAPVSELAPPVTEVKKSSRWLRLSWMLPALALMIALIVQFSGGMPERASAAPEVKAVVVEDKTPKNQEVTPPVTAPVTKIVQPAIEPQLPLENATIVTPAPVITESVAVPVLTEAQSKSALILPSDAVKVGSTTFLNGNWRVSPDIKTAHTGKAPSLKYQIKNGKGTAKITHGDNVTCRANITAGLMKSGNLVINSRYRAQCSDGSKYQMPELVCKQGASGIADCKGRYDANTTLPMTMKRETK